MLRNIGVLLGWVGGFNRFFTRFATVLILSDLRDKDQSTRSDRRAYHRIRSGVTLRHGSGEVLGFLTLTFSTLDVPRDVAKRKLARLLSWIRRSYGRFEYFCVHTAEGQGNVLHLAYFGPFIPFVDIQNFWKHLTGAHRVNIQCIERNYRGLEDFYLEMTRQKLVLRYSYSRKWLWPGACQDWKKITRTCTRWHPAIKQWSFKTATAVRRWQEVIADKRKGMFPVEPS